MDGNSYTYGDEIERLFIFNVSSIDEEEPIDFSIMMNKEQPKKEDDSEILKQLQKRPKIVVGEEKSKDKKGATPEPMIENKEATPVEGKGAQKPSSSTSDTKEKPAARPTTLKLPNLNVDKALNKDKVNKASTSQNGVEKPKSTPKTAAAKNTEKNQQ